MKENVGLRRVASMPVVIFVRSVATLFARNGANVVSKREIYLACHADKGTNRSGSHREQQSL